MAPTHLHAHWRETVSPLKMNLAEAGVSNGVVRIGDRCRAKIKDVEEELSVSYPTVVARLNEVVQAMGFEVRQEDTDLAARRQQILDELASGRLTAADAATRLRSL